MLNTCLSLFLYTFCPCFRSPLRIFHVNVLLYWPGTLDYNAHKSSSGHFFPSSKEQEGSMLTLRFEFIFQQEQSPWQKCLRHHFCEQCRHCSFRHERCAQININPLSDQLFGFNRLTDKMACLTDCFVNRSDYEIVSVLKLKWNQPILLMDLDKNFLIIFQPTKCIQNMTKMKITL